MIFAALLFLNCLSMLVVTHHDGIIDHLIYVVVYELIIAKEVTHSVNKPGEHALMKCFEAWLHQNSLIH